MTTETVGEMPFDGLPFEIRPLRQPVTAAHAALLARLEALAMEWNAAIDRHRAAAREWEASDVHGMRVRDDAYADMASALSGQLRAAIKGDST